MRCIPSLIRPVSCNEVTSQREAGPAARVVERNGDVQARLLAILGFLLFRIPTCIAPILYWNVLFIWTRCSKAWGLLLSGFMAPTTAILPELDAFVFVQ